MNHPLTIRTYHPNDTPSLVELFLDTVRRVNSRDYNPQQIAAWAPDTPDMQAWQTRLQAHHTLVAHVGERIVGFATLERNGHLDRFYVHADMQGQGVGMRLLTTLEHDARRFHIQRLFTEASITARPFFERHGFVVQQQQEVELRGVRFINFRMHKDL